MKSKEKIEGIQAYLQEKIKQEMNEKFKTHKQKLFKFGLQEKDNNAVTFGKKHTSCHIARNLERGEAINSPGSECSSVLSMHKKQTMISINFVGPKVKTK